MSNGTHISDALIERARKLIAMTMERGASEAEAATATRILQQMMAEHNLSLAHIEASGGSTATGGGKRTRENVGRRQVYKWQRGLMAAVAQMNFCKSLERYHSRMRGPSIFDGYDLIGRVDNVTTATLMFDYLLETIERLARAEVNDDPTQFFTRYAHSFKKGCADRLVERLRRQRDEIVAEQEKAAKEAAARSRHPGAAPTTLPALLSDIFTSEADLNNDLENGWEPGTTAARRAKNAAEQAASEAERERRMAEARAQGLSEDAAWYYAYGYTLEKAIEMAKPTAPKLEKPETAKQREARQRREQRESDSYWRRQQREESRLDQGAYRKGHRAGDDISLARQVSNGNQSKIGE